LIRASILGATLALCATLACAQPAPTAKKAPAPAKAPVAAVKTAASAPAWTVEAPASSIEFSGTHAGAVFTGKFERWSADIRFDPANLPGSSARVTIQTGSAKTRDGTQTSTLKSSEWFNVAAHPTATFQTSSIRALGPNRYEAVGTLTIKGKANPVTLPFTLAITGANADMTATLPLDRIALGMGLTSDPRAEWVSRQITLNLRVKAKRAA
jgi:cytochrome b561